MSRSKVVSSKSSTINFIDVVTLVIRGSVPRVKARVLLFKSRMETGRAFALSKVKMIMSFLTFRTGLL